MRSDSALRVLHTPYNIAGHSACLAAAERDLGLDSRNLVLFETASGFPADQVLTAGDGHRLQVELARWRLLWHAIRQADVINYSFGRSILMPSAYPDLSQFSSLPFVQWPRRLYARAVWMSDVQLFAALGKSITVTWQGDDARQGDALRARGLGALADEAGYYDARSDAWKRRIIARFTRHASRQYFLNPDLGWVLPPCARFLPYASFDPFSVEPRPPDAAGILPPLIIHAPSHRGVKGTRFVIEAVKQLRTEGLSLRFELVEGLSRSDALMRYAEADIVVDQLMVGWYGGLAVEAISLAKPVVAHIRQDDLGFVPPAMAQQLPVIDAQPDTITDVLRRLISTPRSELANIGRAGRDYAERWHDPRAIAREMLSDYRAATERRTVI